MAGCLPAKWIKHTHANHHWAWTNVYSKRRSSTIFAIRNTNIAYFHNNNIKGMLHSLQLSLLLVKALLYRKSDILKLAMSWCIYDKPPAGLKVLHALRWRPPSWGWAQGSRKGAMNMSRSQNLEYSPKGLFCVESNRISRGEGLGTATCIMMMMITVFLQVACWRSRKQLLVRDKPQSFLPE